MCKLLSLGSGIPAKCAVLGAMAAAHVLVCAVPYLGSLTRSLLFCLRKDVALVSHKSLAWSGERDSEMERRDLAY